MQQRASRTEPISAFVDVWFWMVELSLAKSLSAIGANLGLGNY